jgi:hypothetical protein
MVGANGVLIDQGTQAVRVGTADVSVITGNAERLRVLNNGNVGIGVSNPSTALQVSGVSSFGGNVGIGVTNPSTALQVSGVSSFGGNVGIGLTDPSSKLHVTEEHIAGDVSRKEVFRGSRIGTDAVQNGVSMAFSLGADRTSISPYGVIDIKTNNLPGPSNVFGLIPDVTVMSLIGNGNVGIGITNPSHILDVFYGIRCYGNGLGGQGYVRAENAASGEAYAIMTLKNDNVNNTCNWFLNSSTRTTDGGSNCATLRNDAGALRLQAQGNGIMINTNGNVGIGTTNPRSPFHVKGPQATDSAVSVLGTGVNSVASIAGGDGNYGLTFTVNDNGFIHLQGQRIGNPGNTDTFPITLNAQGGNVGIGRTSPGETLDVGGGVIVRGRGHVNNYSDTYALNVTCPDSVNGNGSAIVYSNSINLAAGDLTWSGTIRVHGARIYIGGGYSRGGGIDHGEIAMFTSGLERLRIYSDGTTWMAGTVQNASDVTLKKNIEPLPYGLDTISQLNPVTYHLKEQDDSDKKHFGLIAQEVQEILPQIIGKGADDKLSLSYIELVPILINAVKEQQQTIQDLNTRLQRLESLLSR